MFVNSCTAVYCTNCVLLLSVNQSQDNRELRATRVDALIHIHRYTFNRLMVITTKPGLHFMGIFGHECKKETKIWQNGGNYTEKKTQFDFHLTPKMWTLNITAIIIMDYMFTELRSNAACDWSSAGGDVRCDHSRSFVIKMFGFSCLNIHYINMRHNPGH